MTAYADRTISQEYHPENSAYLTSSMGQSFTTLEAGQITQIDIYLADSSSADLRIYAGNTSPNNPAAALYVQTNIPITCSYCWFSIPLSTPLPVEANTQYTWETLGIHRVGNTDRDVYSGGHAWGDPNNAFPNVDLVFRVHIATPDVSISKSVSPAGDAPYHGLVTYTLALNNAGSLADNNVLLTDTLPAEVDFAGWLVQPSGATVTNDVLTWSGTVTASRALTFSFQAAHVAGHTAPVTNTAEFSGTLQAGSDQAVFDVASTADLALVKDGPGSPILIGDAITYTLTVSNAGPDGAPATVVDKLPAGVALNSASGDGWACNSAGQSITCTANLPPLTSAPPILINASAPLIGGPISNTASVSAALDDPTSANNSDMVVTLVDTPPLAVSDVYTGDEDMALLLAAPGVLANDNDSDGDDLSAILDQDVLTGTLDLHSSGAFTYTPESDWNGAVTFSYHANDGWANSNEITVTLIISPVNDPPILNPIGNREIDELITLAFTATASDPDSSGLTFALDAGAPAGAVINPVSGAFTWTPTEQQGPGVYTATVRVSDGALDDAETITVTVTEMNTAPVLAPIGAQNVIEMTELTFTAVATDTDVPTQTLFYSLENAPQGASINATTGLFRWTPTEVQRPGVYTLTVVVSDTLTVVVSDTLLTDSEIITVAVTEATEQHRIYIPVVFKEK